VLKAFSFQTEGELWLQKRRKNGALIYRRGGQGLEELLVLFLGRESRIRPEKGKSKDLPGETICRGKKKKKWECWGAVFDSQRYEGDKEGKERKQKQRGYCSQREKSKRGKKRGREKEREITRSERKSKKTLPQKPPVPRITQPKTPNPAQNNQEKPQSKKTMKNLPPPKRTLPPEENSSFHRPICRSHKRNPDRISPKITAPLTQAPHNNPMKPTSG